ncbi:hypothetical protein [Paraburkholderia caffeinilytica]|uniref:hypothetical protein n=1 Tax=Paraburkholderia caffeinilytica TaxID=1761016 RepID=UPI003DA17B46
MKHVGKYTPFLRELKMMAEELRASRYWSLWFIAFLLAAAPVLLAVAKLLEAIR